MNGRLIRSLKPTATVLIGVHVLVRSEQKRMAPQLPTSKPSSSDRLCTAFARMVDDPECLPVLDQFRVAYEFRAKQSWLGESGTFLGALNADGLAYALRTALATYVVPSQIRTDRTSCAALSQPMWDSHHEGDTLEWRQRLKDAFYVAMQDGLSFERFKKRLMRAGVDMCAISLSDVQTHIKQALVGYVRDMETGIAYDPT